MALWTNIRRVTRIGFFNFWRNGFVSLSSVLVMTVALLVISSTIFFGQVLDHSLSELKKKVDVNVYFVTDAPESDILSLKASLEKLPEVQSTEYVSREQVLDSFRQLHANDEITLQALDELGSNPFGATLNVKAVTPSQYEGIAKFLDQEDIANKDGARLIDKVNYNQNKAAIDNLSKVINTANRLGLIIVFALVILSIIITFNTIRLAIYISREEIGVMRLVGASAAYIRWPFVVGGMLNGIVSGIVTLILLYPITYWLAQSSREFFLGFDIFAYYLAYFGQIFLIIVGVGIAIGAVSSYLAVMRYLRR